ncbi:uncharacterized protein EV154DRAFT_484181 [Mucor mucedo]|uniref:uncharacterized protein n=1 Tax=Mucor mucedo TaxID=29922 RepID=UPI00221FB15F|nr:uncharacterized protein EV154DRAFT_484181 [Mucor mucedo]KAI7888319.1 hypothetical protein EV154DRAFT_484181 [Mucor mucedo]
MKLRGKTLIYWRSILPIPTDIIMMKSIGAQFFELSLTIRMSLFFKIWCLTSVRNILSLRRALLLNYKKLKALARICEVDSIQFSASNSTDVQCRSDSAETDHNESERVGLDWKQERLRRLHKSIVDVRKIGFDDNVLTLNDWEDVTF